MDNHSYISEDKDDRFYYVTLPAGSQFSTVRRIYPKQDNCENPARDSFWRIL